MIERLFPRMNADVDLSPAFRRLIGLLWLSCRNTPPPAFDPRVPAAGTTEEAELTALAIYHGVIPWLLRRLDPLQDYLSPELIQLWRDYDRSNGLRALSNCMWVLRLTNALQTAEISSLPIKGVCTAVRYYGDASARSSGDIDLMVTPDDLEQARQVLLELGLTQTFPQRELNRAEARWLHKRMHHLTFRESSSNLLIELHWALHDNNLLNREDREWPRLANDQLTIGGRSIAALDPPRDYLLLLTHAGRSVWARLKWLLDLHLAWNALSDEHRVEVAGQIQRLRLEPAQRIFMQLSEVLLGSASRSLPSTLPVEIHFLLDRSSKPRLQMMLLDVRNLYRLRTSISYCWDTLKLRAVSWQDIELLRLPSFAFPMYVLLRLPLLIYRLLSQDKS